jgi:hypothetical protein
MLRAIEAMQKQDEPLLSLQQPTCPASVGQSRDSTSSNTIGQKSTKGVHGYGVGRIIAVALLRIVKLTWKWLGSVAPGQPGKFFTDQRAKLAGGARDWSTSYRDDKERRRFPGPFTQRQGRHLIPHRSPPLMSFVKCD